MSERETIGCATLDEAHSSHTAEAGGIINMGLSKYTRDERKIVYRIQDLCRMINHNKKKIKQYTTRRDKLIKSLAPKYKRKS